MHNTNEHAAAAQTRPTMPQRTLIAVRSWRAHNSRTTSMGTATATLVLVDQLAGETTARAVTEGALRQKVAASAKLTTIEPNAKSMKSIGTGTPPVTTYTT